MQIKIDFRSGQPIYIQIIEQIYQLATRGELKPGDQLPTVRQLASDLGVNFNTVARAYRLLDESGVISTQQGRGTYLWESPSEESFRRLRQKSLESLTLRYLADAAHREYSPAEVANTFQRLLQDWEERDQPPVLASEDK